MKSIPKQKDCLGAKHCQLCFPDFFLNFPTDSVEASCNEILTYLEIFLKSVNSKITRLVFLNLEKVFANTNDKSLMIKTLISF